MNFGFWSLLPVVVIIVFALITKDTFISLFLGVATGFIMVAGGNPVKAFNGFLDSLYTVMTDQNTAWVLLICGLFGSLIMLITEAGGRLGVFAVGRTVFEKQDVLYDWNLDFGTHRLC